jgi:hypothetical protein
LRLFDRGFAPSVVIWGLPRKGEKSKKPRRRFEMKASVFAIAAALLISGLTAKAQKPCGCADKQYLIDALKQNQMVRQELDFQMKLVIALEEKPGGKSIMPTAEGVKDLYTEITNAKKSVADGDDTYSSGETIDNVDCSVSRTDTFSDCKELIKKQLFDVIQKACLANKSSRGPGEPYYAVMQMRSYLLQLMTAYQKQHEFILQMLGSLPRNCRPNNWFGYVFYRRVQTETSVLSKPRKTLDSKNAVGPSTGLRTEKNTYIGKISVEGGKAVSGKAYGAQKMDGTNSFARVCPIVGGRLEQVSVANEKFFAEDEKAGYGSLAINVLSPHSYRLDVVFSPVVLTGDITMWGNTVSGKCTDERFEYNSTRRNLVDVKPGGPLSITEQNESPDFLEGNQDQVRPTETFKSGDESVTKTEEIKLRWMLWRLPQK